MKHWHVGVAALAAFLLGHAFAQEEPMQGWTPPDWMKAGDEHAELAKSVGEFDVKGEIFMVPDQPPMVMPATATRKVIKNGLFVQEDFKGNFMGQPFHGTLIEGYDTFRKRHVSVWFDNSSPVMQISHGEKKDGKFIWESNNPDPQLNKIIPMKSVLEEKNGKMVMSFYRIIDGKDVIHMRLTYSKKG
ncbi:MAG: DUF1579 family protein [Planctomycetota bacterium]|jgi:hypothetical protein